MSEEPTPGPWYWGDGWTCDEEEKYMDFRLLGANREEIIPIRVDHHEPIWDVDLFHSYGGAGITSKADRDLIASAPDLLEALEAYLDAVSGVPMRAVDCDQDEVERAHWLCMDAIAKARGEEPTDGRD